MSVLLLFFGDQTPIVPDPPLGIGLGSGFSVSCDTQMPFEQTPFDVVVDGLHELRVEFIPNCISLDVSGRHRARIVIDREQSMAIAVSSRPVALMHFEPDNAFDISVSQYGEIRLAFFGDAGPAFFDIDAVAGKKVRLEFVNSLPQSGDHAVGDDAIIEYIPFVI